MDVLRGKQLKRETYGLRKAYRLDGWIGIVGTTGSGVPGFRGSEVRRFGVRRFGGSEVRRFGAQNPGTSELRNLGTWRRGER
jgi:hypothetical protein